MSLEALKKLFTSAKSSLLIVVTILLLVLLQLGHIDATQFLSAMKILVPGWMISHAVETGLKALAEGKTKDLVELLLDRMKLELGSFIGDYLTEGLPEVEDEEADD